MKTYLLLFFLGINLLLVGNSTKKAIPFKNQSLVFWENRGQFIAQDTHTENILFMGSSNRSSVYVTKKGLLIQSHTVSNNECTNETESSSLFIEVVGGTISANKIIKEEQIKGYMNYYYPHCAEGIKMVPGYQKITIKDIYPGIDWVLFGEVDKKGFTHEFHIKPGGNVNQIHLTYHGSTSLLLNHEANILQIHSQLGTMEEGKLLCYDKQTKKAIPSTYVVEGNKVSYQLDETVINKENTIVIDPYMSLVWGTIWAGGGNELPYDIQENEDGSAFYIVGYTTSTQASIVDDGATAGLGNGTYDQGSNAGSNDMFVIKFDTNGIFLWGTLYGGTGSDVARGMDINSSGDIYIAGTTSSSDIPLTNSGSGFYYSTYQGNTDAFFIRMTTAGAVSMATYVGGTDNEWASDVVVDNTDNVYFATNTESSIAESFPAVSGTTSLATDKGGSDALEKVCIFKFNSFDTVIWSGYQNAGGDQSEPRLAIDPSNQHLILSGEATATITLVNPGGGAYQKAYSTAFGGTPYVTELDASGTILWSTHFAGGSATDEYTVNGIDVASDGTIYIVGETDDYFDRLDSLGNFYQSAYGGGASDGFLLRFDNNRTLVLSTFFGGTGAESLLDVFVGEGDTVWVCGNMSSGALVPNLNSANYQDASKTSANFQSYAMQFAPDMTPIYGSYFESSSHNWATDIFVTNTRHLYIVGQGWGPDNSNPQLTDPGPTAYYQSAVPGGTGDGAGIFIYQLKDDNYLILPVELLNFSAERAVNGIELQWMTFSEINAESFRIERSRNGIFFSEIGRVSANGNSNQAISYEFMDINAGIESYYYRLKIVDFDGSFEYSKVIYVSTSDDLTLGIYPNPTSDLLKITSSTDGEIFIYNSSNQLVLNQVYTGLLDVSNLSDGVYSLVMKDKGKIFREIFIKE